MRPETELQIFLAGLEAAIAKAQERGEPLAVAALLISKEKVKAELDSFDRLPF